MSSIANSPESTSSVVSPALPPVNPPVVVSNQVTAPESLEQMNLNPVLSGEGTEMVDALLQGSCNIPNQLSIPDSTATTKNNPVDVLKKIIYHRDHYLSLLADMITTNSSEPKAVRQLCEIREKIENLNKDINISKNSIRLSKDKVSAAVHHSLSNVASPAQGIRLNCQSMPKFQLKSSNN